MNIQDQQKEEADWEEHARSLSQHLSNSENQIKIREMVSEEKSRFGLDLDKLREESPQLVQAIIQNPVKGLQILQRQVNQLVEDTNADNFGKKQRQNSVTQREKIYRVTFEGNLGRNLITPRGLTSQMVNQLVAVQGIVTRQSIVRPKLLRSVHYCEKTQKGSVKDYNDDFELTQDKDINLNNTYPTKDSEGNPLTTEFGYCRYNDFQTLLLQEMPEKAPTGLLPRSVEIILEEDLVDKVKPGDRIQVVGVYKSMITGNTNYNGVFKCMLVATSIEVLANDVTQNDIQGQDIPLIRDFSTRPDLLNIMSQSIAPSIFGHEEIKKSVLLMLLGGTEKILENQTHLRGDLNILIIGDPSTAKSQMLRRVLSIAPLAINTTGKGTSGVGLTAAVVVDRDTGEKHLTAGAMVLADRG